MTPEQGRAPSSRRVLARNTVWMPVGQGARVVSIASDGLLAVMLWSILWSVCRREDRKRVAAVASSDPVFAVATGLGT